MKFMPQPYQQYCIERGIAEPALGCFLDMGLGKTVITETIFNDLRLNRFLVSNVLIVAPKKVAEATWQKEAAKWDHLKHLRFSTVMGTEQQRIRALCTPADAYIINRDNIHWLTEYYRNDWPFDMVILDESSSFKNPEAVRFKSLCRKRARIRRILLLTGTPAPNGLLDLWSQVYLLDQGKRLYSKFGQYRSRFFDLDYSDNSRNSYDIKEGSEAWIHNQIKDICISMKAEDYLTLPDLIIDDIPVALDSKAQAAYDKMEREAVLEMDGQEITASTAAVLTNKLLQLGNGAVYDGTRNVVEIHSNKVEAFMETLEQIGDKPVLVFYSFQHDLTRLQQALAGTGKQVRLLQTVDDQDAWNRHEIDVLLAHPASAAYGLNLQEGGNHMIWFGLNWSLELYQQAIKRLHRQGQTEKVIVHRLLVVGGVDEDVAAALEDKSGTQNRLIDAIRARVDRIRATA